MNCVLCGRRLLPQARFCENCGTQVASPGALAAAAPDPLATELPSQLSSPGWAPGQSEPPPMGFAGSLPDAAGAAPRPRSRPAQGDAPRLRPLGYGELLDESVDLFRKNFLLFVGIAGIVYLPGGMLLAYMQVSMLRHPADPTMMLGAMSGLILISCLYSMGSQVARAAVIMGVARRYLNHSATIANCYQAVLPRMVPYFVMAFLEGVIIVVGFALCILPGVFAMMSLAFCSEAFIIEGLGIFDSIQRSRNLVEGQMMRVFVLNLVLVVLMMVLYGIPSGLVGALVHSTVMAQTINSLWQSIGNSFIAPLFMIANVLLYYDIRVRKEGFDLQILAEHIGAPT